VRRLIQFSLIGGAFGLVLISALAATNAVPASKAGQTASVISVDSKKPRPSCNGITVTTLVLGANGTSGGDLLLGTAAANTMAGNGGSDCIHGGGGNDLMAGGTGTDVCIGGPGTDTFQPNCETQIQ
jgi:Ca2+-binding RTX toxin-like protein